MEIKSKTTKKNTIFVHFNTINLYNGTEKWAKKRPHIFWSTF